MQSIAISVYLCLSVCLYVQGGPAKVRPTYIFAGNISMHRFLANVITV